MSCNKTPLINDKVMSYMYIMLCSNNVCVHVEAHTGLIFLLLQTIFCSVTHKDVPLNICNLPEQNNPLLNQ